MPPMIKFGSRLVRRLLGASVAIGGMAAPASAQWTVTNLHPAGAGQSTCNGVGGGQQMGHARFGPTVGDYRAGFWSGTSASWVNLHPAGVSYSYGWAPMAALRSVKHSSLVLHAPVYGAAPLHHG